MTKRGQTTLQVIIRPEFKELIRQQAEKNFTNISDYVRHALWNQMRQELELNPKGVH
ncbi:hypothetical protein [Myxosarcina sp. GI1(2024)]